MQDLISRQAAVDALWKALWKYEDDSEQAFQTHEELDIGEWFQHRIFVQRMSDIDRDTIADMPSADVEPVVRCKDCVVLQTCRFAQWLGLDGYCSQGARMDGEQDVASSED